MQNDTMTDEGHETKNFGGWRRAVVVLVSLFVFLAVLGVVLPGFMDWTPYRDRFEALASDMAGRSVTIGGNVSFRLLPTPAFSAGAVEIATLPDGRASYLARIERLDMELALFPLLRGDIEFRRFALIRPDIRAERLPDGRVTWRLGRSEEISAKATDISLDDFVIRDGVLYVDDALMERRWQFSKIDATIKVQSLAGPFQVKGAAVSDDLALSFEIKAGRFRHGSRVPVSLDISLADSDLSLSGWVRPQQDMAQADFALSASLDSLNSARSVREWAHLSGIAPSRPWTASKTDMPLSLKAEIAGGRQITVGNIKGRLGDSAFDGKGTIDLDAGPAIDFALNVDGIDMNPFFAAYENGGPDDEGDEVVGLSIPELPRYPFLPAGMTADLSLAVAALKYRDDHVRDLRVKTQIAHDGIILETLEANLPGASRMTLTGAVAQGDAGSVFDGRLAVSSGSLRTVLDWLAPEHVVPQGRLTAFRLASGLSLVPGKISLSEMDMILDASHITGRIALEQGADLPRLRADLAMDRLDLDGYLPARDPALPALTVQDLVVMLNDLLGMSYGATADVHGTVKRLRYAGHRLEDMSFALVHEAGRLIVGELKAGDLNGLSLSLSGQLEAGDDLPRFSLSLHGRTADFATFVADMGYGAMADIPSGEALLDARLKGGVQDLYLDLSVGIAGARVTAKGTASSVLTAYETGEGGAVDLDFTFDHISHRELASELGLAWLAKGDALPLHLALELSGPLSGIAFTGDAALLGGDLTLSGSYGGWVNDPALDLQITAMHPSLTGLVRQIDPAYRPTGEDPGAVSLFAKLGYREAKLAIGEFALDSGETVIKASGSADFSTVRPRLDVALDATTLSLSDLASRGTSVGDDKAGGDAVKGRWSHKPYDLSGLRAVDGRFHVKAAALDYGAWPFRALDVAARLAEGVFYLDEGRAELFGGRLQMTGQLDGTAVPRLSLDMTLEDAELSDLTVAGLDVKAASGRATVSAAVETEGLSQYAMVSQLTGTMRLEARDGAVTGFDLAALTQGVAALKRPADVAALLQAFQTGEETVFRRLAADIAVNDGVLASENLSVDLGTGTLSGQFQADLAGWALTAGGIVSLTDHPSAPAIGIDLGGDLSRPAVALDLGPLRRWLLVRAVKGVPIRLPMPDARDLPVPEVVGRDKKPADDNGPPL